VRGDKGKLRQGDKERGDKARGDKGKLRQGDKVRGDKARGEGAGREIENVGR
jgi:hypothetical protein